MKDNTYYHRGFKIVPKRDFGSVGYLSDGKWIKKGWLVLEGTCNIMPGATWFHTIEDAKYGIDVWLRVKRNADRFWEIMQPFDYKRVGQKADFENGHVRKGRFLAVIENFRVVKLRRNLPANGL